jgi:RNA polymerase sigma-70 factor, ECF subfamily
MEGRDSLDTALASARAGDESGFLALWTDLNPRLLRYLRVLGCDDADDVASESWLQAVRDLGRFHGSSADEFRAWLFTIARHRAVDASRSRSRRPDVPLTGTEAGPQPLAPDAADLALESISTQSVVALVKMLPPEHAEIIMLRVVAGLEAADVARIVGKTPGAVRVTAHRALRRLAELAERAGVTH